MQNICLVYMSKITYILHLVCKLISILCLLACVCMFLCVCISGCVEMLTVMYRKGCSMSTGSRWRPRACAASFLLLCSTPMVTLFVEMDSYKGMTHSSRFKESSNEALSCHRVAWHNAYYLLQWHFKLRKKWEDAVPWWQKNFITNVCPLRVNVDMRCHYNICNLGKS